MLRTRDIAIASLHGFDGSRSGSVAQNTRMFIGALTTPGIHILGHPGRSGAPFDLDALVRTARDAGKLLEINEHSFDFEGEHLDVCRRLAEKCAEEGVSVVVSSDAHSPYTVGCFDKALTMLEGIGFPQALIANESLDKLMGIVRRANERDGFVSKP